MSVAKENTHLHFAYGLLEDLRGQPVWRDISAHVSHYLLGSVIPDTFYYGSSASYRRISESLHGKDGNPTNATILQVLESSREHNDLAFILGFITHCALDITFHPIVYYLSGNYYDETPEKRNHAVYLHRHLETCLDLDIGNTMRFHRIIRTRQLEGLVFERIISERFGVSAKSLRHCLRRQICYNFLFTSSAAYTIATAAARSGLFADTSQLGLFYADASHGDRFPSLIEAADLIDGTPRATTVDELFLAARTLAKTMMEAACGYWNGFLTREELIHVIPGLSLDTGRLGVSASGIRFTRWERPQENL